MNRPTEFTVVSAMRRHHVLAHCIQQNLLKVDIGNLLPDLAEVDDRVHRMLRYSLEAFLEYKERSDAA